MEIHGLNKLTLLDYPEHLACTVFTGRCNLRCPFCHNAGLVLLPANQPSLDTGEILRFLEKRSGTLEGVCITGGEPTLQNDLADFMKEVKKLGYLIKLDTNGTRPDVLEELISEQLLDYIAMDIKNCPEKYAKTCGLPLVRMESFERSIELIKSSGIAYEFRTTVVKEFHEKEDFLSIGKWLNGAKRYALQAFLDSGDLITPGLTGHDTETLKEFQALLTPYFDQVLLRGVN